MKKERLHLQESNVFMRKFAGEASTLVCSLARFPLSQFDEVVKVLEKERYTKENFGADEFDGKHTFVGSSREGGWFMITRKIGESKWNIVRLGGSIHHSITDADLKHLVTVLRENKIDVDVPQTYLEYIPPTDTFDPENPSETRSEELSDVNIADAQAMEKKWHEDRLKMTPEQLARRTYY